jgi:hypothetical protein
LQRGLFCARAPQPSGGGFRRLEGDGLSEGVFRLGVLDTGADVGGLREALAGGVPLAEVAVGETEEVERVGLAPGITAFGVRGAGQGLGGVAEGFRRGAAGEGGMGEGEEEVDGEEAKAVGVGEEEAFSSFGVGEVGVVFVELDGGGEAMCTEGDLEVAGAGGPGAGLDEVLAGFGGSVGKEEVAEEGVEARDVAFRGGQAYRERG